MNKKELSTLIRSFVNGSCGPGDWDDFLSIRQKDPEIEQLRLRIIEIEKEYPRTKAKTWCSEEGMQELLRIAETLSPTR